MNEKEIKVKGDLNFQPYFNQVIASNFVTAFYTAKQVSTNKPDEEIFEEIFLFFTKMLKLLEMIPTKKIPSE